MNFFQGKYFVKPHAFRMPVEVAHQIVMGGLILEPRGRRGAPPKKWPKTRESSKMGGIGSTLHVAPGIPLKFRTSECWRFFRHLQTGLNRVLCVKIALPDHLSRFVQNRKNRKLFFRSIFFLRFFFLKNVENFDTFSSFPIFRFFKMLTFRKIFKSFRKQIWKYFFEKCFRPKIIILDDFFFQRKIFA